MKKRVFPPMVILYSTAGFGSNCVEVFCEEEKAAVINFFKESLDAIAKKFTEEYIDEYGDIDEYVTPCDELLKCFEENDEGVLFTFANSLDIQTNENVCDFYDEVIVKALKELIKQFPNIAYDGFLFYDWSDQNCGECNCSFISSSESEKYKSKLIDEKLQSIMNKCLKMVDAESFFCHLNDSSILECLDFFAEYEESEKYPELIGIVFDACKECGIEINHISKYIRKLMNQRCLNESHCEKLLDIAENDTSVKAEILNYSNSLLHGD